MPIDRGSEAALGIKRSEYWPKVEEAFKKSNPICAACGGPATELNVHHVFPFHMVILAGRPDLELDPRNLITLCVDPEFDHHLYVGHLGNFVSFNAAVVNDCKTYGKIAKASLGANASWLAERVARPSGHFADDAAKAAFLAELNTVFGATPKVDLKGNPLP